MIEKGATLFIYLFYFIIIIYLNIRSVQIRRLNWHKSFQIEPKTNKNNAVRSRFTIY